MMRISSKIAVWCGTLALASPVVWACWPSQNVTVLAHIPLDGFASNPSGANDCWGYTSPSGREYALMGLRNALAVVEITAPSFPVIVAEVPHFDSNWSDVKVYGNHAYVVNEAGGGMDVIDLSDVDNGVVTLVQRLTTGGLGTSHNVAVDTDSGFLYVLGSNLNQGRLVVYDLSDPANPVLAGQMSSLHGDYVHDAQVVRYPGGSQIAFAAVGGLGLDIYDVTDKANMVRLSRSTYPNLSFAHQCWTEDRAHLYLNDEADGNDETVIFDITNLLNPTVVGTYSSGTAAEDHNQYVHQGFVYEADYRSGLRVFDATVPTAPVPVGYLDTFPDDDGPASGGAWSVYPFFPSGNLIVSDKDNGLFVARLGPPPLTFSYPSGLPDRFDPSGETFQVQVAAQGGEVLDAASPALHYTTPTGTVSVPMPSLGGGLYEAAVGALPCGWVARYWVSAATTSGMQILDPSSAPCDGALAVAAVTATVLVDDPLEVQGDWVVGAADDNATQGLWEHADPIATEGQPGTDHTPDPAAACFVTGQGGLLDVLGQNDVDDGKTTLQSPVYDLGADDAAVSFWLWYDNDFALIDADEGTAPNSDFFTVDVSGDGGASWTNAHFVGPSGAGGWMFHSFRVSDFVAPTSTTRLRFVASDYGLPSVVEAALDDVRVTSITCNSPGAGRVPDGQDMTGSPLTVTPAPGGDLMLSWSASCLATDNDYAVYEGSIGDFTSHVPLTCSTGGLTTETITPSGGSTYYLVVPHNGNQEGSYGADGQGAARPASTAGCLDQNAQSCN